MYEVKLPFLAEGVNEATVSYWLVDEGDAVNEGDELVEMMTSKAVFNVPSPVTGTLNKQVAKEGRVVRVGEVLAEFEVEGTSQGF